MKPAIPRVGRSRDRVGLFCHILGLFCHILDLFCHTSCMKPAVTRVGRSCDRVGGRMDGGEGENTFYMREHILHRETHSVEG